MRKFGRFDTSFRYRVTHALLLLLFFPNSFHYDIVINQISTQARLRMVWCCWNINIVKAIKARKWNWWRIDNIAGVFSYAFIFKIMVFRRTIRNLSKNKCTKTDEIDPCNNHKTTTVILSLAQVNALCWVRRMNQRQPSADGVRRESQQKMSVIMKKIECIERDDNETPPELTFSSEHDW